jgi:hypothetical protein
MAASLADNVNRPGMPFGIEEVPNVTKADRGKRLGNAL